MGWKKRFASLPLLLIGGVASETIGWGWSRLLDAIWPMVADMTWRDVLGITCWIAMIGSIIWMLWPWPKEASKSERLAMKADEAEGMLSMLLSGHYRRDEEVQKVASNVAAARTAFAKMGFHVPIFEGDGSFDPEVAKVMQRYFIAVSPHLRDGHLKEAKAIASQFRAGVALR